MSKFQEKTEARKMRQEGRSIKDIARSLKVSRSSVSVWCRDIILSEEQIVKLQGEGLLKNMHGRLKGARINKEKKEKNIKSAEKEAEALIGDLSRRDVLMLVVGLFWGEGSKTGSRFIFVNSDPRMVLMVRNFLIGILGVDKDDIRATIQINQVHESRILEITEFWADLLSIKPEHFNKPYFIKVKPKKEYSNYDTYKGILRLRVLRSSTIQYKMLGLIKSVCRGKGILPRLHSKKI